MVFDLPFREISKIVSTHVDNGPTEAKSNDDKESDANENTQVDADADEIWNNDSHAKVTFADNEAADDDIYSKRSFTPVWKKSDDEKPVWGDDDDDVGDTK